MIKITTMIPKIKSMFILVWTCFYFFPPSSLSGIVLSWNMTLSPASHAIIASYQIYAYQETPQQKAEPTLWKKVGDVKALALPMACTLTQFLKGNKYHFAVRAKDVHTRVGHFSDPQSIALT